MAVVIPKSDGYHLHRVSFSDCLGRSHRYSDYFEIRKSSNAPPARPLGDCYPTLTSGSRLVGPQAIVVYALVFYRHAQAHNSLCQALCTAHTIFLLVDLAGTG